MMQARTSGNYRSVMQVTEYVLEEVLHSVYTAKNTFVEYTFDPELVVTNTESLYFSVTEVVWVNKRKAPKKPTIQVYYYG